MGHALEKGGLKRKQIKILSVFPDLDYRAFWALGQPRRADVGLVNRFLQFEEV